MRGWPAVRRGAVILAIGVAATAVSFFAARHDAAFFVICLAPVLYGLLGIVRGLTTIKTARQLEALRRPLSERKPWLFAQAPFGTNPDGSPAPPEPGWHPDPTNAAAQRWHDGQNWTEDTRAVTASTRGARAAP
ncbi:MAG TPA: DUF2510 domain-containing protein [Streptosporangiaceae bacterium]|nr:DUF2510 domain-containing protein [Streptosporangiaceae bacterium]